jgi:hypothetical protein
LPPFKGIGSSFLIVQTILQAPTTVLPKIFEKTNAGIKIIYIFNMAFVFEIFQMCLSTCAVKPSSPAGPGFTSLPV